MKLYKKEINLYQTKDEKYSVFKSQYAFNVYVIADNEAGDYIEGGASTLKDAENKIKLLVKYKKMALQNKGGQ